MTRNSLLLKVQYLMHDDLDLMEKKSKDYAPEDDALKNFKLGGYNGILIRMNDKFNRLLNLVSQVGITNEPIIDTFQDIRIYAYLTQIMWEQEQRLSVDVVDKIRKEYYDNIKKEEK